MSEQIEQIEQSGNIEQIEQIEQVEQAADTEVQEASAQAQEPAAQARVKTKRSRIPYEKKKSMYGYGFISIWLVGTIYFFIMPLIKSLVYSFHTTAVEPGGLQLTWVGLDNYTYGLYGGDPRFLEYLSNSLVMMLQKTPMILMFSLFVAVLLNQKFHGRTFARAVFFLPVIIATGPVISVINGDMGNQGVQTATQFSTLFETDLVGSLMEFVGIYNINPTFTETIQDIMSNIFNLVWNSGIQILIFLAALQNIPVAAKEAAQMEGATAWEYFWKITIPYVSPMILANLVYTVIDSFVDPQNELMVYVRTQASDWKHGYSAALAWIFFIIIAVCLGIVVGIVSKFVYYEVE